MKLSDLPIPEPCSFSREEMTERRPGQRFCPRCQKTVFDLSALSEKRAKQLLKQTGGDLCVEYWVDDDDDIEFAKPSPRSSLRVAAAVALPLAVAACNRKPDPNRDIVSEQVEPVKQATTPAPTPEPAPVIPIPIVPIPPDPGSATSSSAAAADKDAGAASTCTTTTTTVNGRRRRLAGKPASNSGL